MKEDDLRTHVAMQAIDFASAFRAVVGHMRLPPAAYVPELMAPEGLSTQSGHRALQRIRLVPANDGFPTLVVGGANVKLGTSELRSYEYVDALHREHFGRPVELDRAAYEEFLAHVRNYFTVAQFKVTVLSRPPISDVPPPWRRGFALALGFVVIALLLAALAVGYAMQP